MKFEELTEGEWSLIKPLLPPPALTGRPRADDRTSLNSIFYVLITGCKWEDFRLVISAANEHESKYFIDLLSKISLKGESGRPRTRPIEINADASYDSSEIRQYLRRRGIKSNIPVNKRNSKSWTRVRPTRFDGEAYKNRGSVERFNAWIESFKRVMVRFERLEVCFMAVVNLACIKMILRVLK